MKSFIVRKSHFLLPVAALLLCLSILNINGCGFKLRGSLDLPDHLKTLHITGRDKYGTFVTETSKYLQKNGIKVVERAADAPFTIDILREDSDKRAIAVSNKLRDSDYALSQEIEFEVRGRDGVRLLMPSTIKTERIFSFNENQVRAKEREQQQLQKEMRRDLMTQLLRRIQSLKEVKPDAT